MRSLILKDLYNIGHNAKSMLFMLAVLAVILIPTSGASAYIIVSAVLCSMMIVTTFTFDENSKWTRYAMIMPVTKKNLVAGKYVVMAIFCVIGSLFGLIVSMIAGLVLRKMTFDIEGIVELLILALVAFALSLVSGSMSIPLVFKFGAEKARVLLVVSIFVPLAVCFGLYQVLVLLGIELTERLIFILLCCSPVFALVWCYLMYCICCRIFENGDKIRSCWRDMPVDRQRRQ